MTGERARTQVTAKKHTKSRTKIKCKTGELIKEKGANVYNTFNLSTHTKKKNAIENIVYLNINTHKL